MVPLCAICFSAFSSRDTAASVGALRFGIGEGSGAGLGAPASQTLIVLSHEPDTTVLPSGEKATEDTITLLCALCFSAFSSREAAASVRALRFGLGEGSGRLGYLHPTL